MSFESLYLYVPDEGRLLPKYSDCTTSNGFELYSMRCGVMHLLLILYTVYPHPFAVHRSRPRILADFALKVSLNNFGNFVNFLEEYLHKKGMEFHLLLLVDNAGGHPVDLHHEGVQIELLPPTPHHSSSR